MTTQEQSAGSLCFERDENHDRVPQKAVHRKVTSAQLRLAKFICEREVADFQDVVNAMEAREYQKVDEWKAEAQRKGPPVHLVSFPRFTLKLGKKETDPTSLTPPMTGATNDNNTSCSQ